MTKTSASSAPGSSTSPAAPTAGGGDPPPAIFPTRMRGFGMGVCGVVLWMVNFAIGLTFPVLVDAVGISAAFFVFAVLGVAAITFVGLRVPETRGRSLEALQGELRARYGKPVDHPAPSLAS
ncbi:MFS transporter [Streptomyces sp. NPDC096310]|uniref:MFS transporter n=1 Tax=Streptomyces sp. NPDC096310 TaxID=3366082 RepID=UPI0037FF38B8